MGRGGKRPGAGMPKGKITRKTLEKIEARRIFEQILREKLLAAGPDIIDAQIEHAKGVSYLTLRNPDGSFTRATDVKQIDAAYAAGEETFRLFTQSPNTQAFTALSDRAFDKPKEQAQDINLTVTDALLSKVQRARERAKK